MNMTWAWRQTLRRFTIRSALLFTLLLAVTPAGWNGIAPAGSETVQAAPNDPNTPDIATGYTPGAIDWQPCPDNARTRRIISPSLKPWAIPIHASSVVLW
jgi:hypothetical protein